MPALTSLAIGAAVAGAAGSVAGGVIGADAQGKAADQGLQGQREAIIAQEKALERQLAAQEAQAEKARQFQLGQTELGINALNSNGARAESTLRDQYGQSRADLEPFHQAQLQALGQLQGLTDPNSEFANSQRSAATQAIQRQLAAQGLLRSKKQSDLLSNLELGLSEQRNNIIGGLANNGTAQSLSGLAQAYGANMSGLQSSLGANTANIRAGLGAQGANLEMGLGNSIGGAIGNYGNALSNAYQNMGQINAQGTLGMAHALTGGLAGLNNAFQGGVSNAMSADFYNTLKNSLSGNASNGLLSQQVAGFQVLPAFKGIGGR